MTSPAPFDSAKDLPVVITGLGGVETAVNGRIVELSPSAMCLRAEYALALGRPLKIEAHDTLWLGEVVQCEPEGGEYRIVVTLAHALHGLADLARLAERFLRKPRGTPEATPVARN